MGLKASPEGLIGRGPGGGILKLTPVVVGRPQASPTGRVPSTTWKLASPTVSDPRKSKKRNRAPKMEATLGFFIT